MSEQTATATGRTLDEAKRAAADALGVNVYDCEFEVIEQGSKGLFAKDNFKVRATLAEKPKPARTRASKTREDTGEPSLEKAAVELQEGDAVTPDATEEDGIVCRDLVAGLFEACELRIDVEVESVSGKYVNLSLSGADAGMLLEPKNPAIDSIQYLANAMLTRVLPGGVRLTLDARKYREQRRATLEEEARSIAEEVVRIQQEAVFDALPAHERRIIHQALVDFAGVTTYSEGEEPNRRVVISPKTEGDD